ncbi:RE1, partial [Symbiodinium pilosum]
MKSEDRSWTTGALDIRTAFLLAPLEQTKRVLVLRPPKVLISGNIVHPQELWYATGAICGLREAPAAWSSYKDSQLPNIQIQHGEEFFRLVRSKADQNLWHLKPASDLEAAPVALLGVYVDDMIGTGPRAILDSLFLAVQKTWETSRPQFASDKEGILFCGLEIHDTGDRLHIHQRKYLLDLLNRYPDVRGGASQPGLKEPDDLLPKNNEQPDLSRLRLAQKLAGELLWITTKTRPDLIYVTSRIGQYITRNVEFAIQLAHNALRYLRSTAHYEIIYGGNHSSDQGPDVGPLQERVGAVEAYADASFAPGNDRSQTGIILAWNQAPITWLSMRQPCASLSTAEAELQSSIDALALTEGFLPLIQELEPRPVKTFLYNDNQGAVTVMKIPQGSWRTRHLRLKAAWFFEQLETSRYAVYHLPGKYMLGDLCTKTLQSLRIRELLQMMRINIVDPVEGESKAAVVKKLESDPNDHQPGGVRSGGEGLKLSEKPWGGAVELVELDAASESATKGEGRVSSPGIPNMGVVKRALKLLLGALCLKRSTGKVVVTIEEDKHELDVTTWTVAVLALVGVVLLCCGLAVGVARWAWTAEGPRIQSVRVEEDEESENWSVLSSAELREGIDEDGYLDPAIETTQIQ